MKRIVVKLIGLWLNILALASPSSAGRKGFYLFCTPRRVSLKDHQRNFLDSAEKSSFECEGTTIQVYRWGTGKKKILFLHGWQSHSVRWKNYIESFSKEEFTMYALDAPGHGLSGGTYLNLPIYSNVVECFLYSIQPVHTIVGHSLGSFAILYTLFRVPSLSVQQLVITGTPGEVKDFTKFYQQMLGLSTRTMRAIYQSFQKIIHHLPEYFSATRFAKAIELPTLIIHDEHDKETPHHHALEIHAVAKNSRLITTSGLGHNLRSANVLKHVVDFANQSTLDQEMVENVTTVTG